MHLVGAVTELAGEGDNLTDDELGDTARVTERRIEDGNAMIRGKLEIDLVGADTEAADGDQVVGLFEDAGGEFSLGTDTNDMDIAGVCQLEANGEDIRHKNSPDLFDELILGQRGLEELDLVALLGEDIAAGLVHILEQQDLDVLGGKGLEMFGIGEGDGAVSQAGGGGLIRGGGGGGEMQTLGDAAGRKVGVDVLGHGGR